jgi:hypothetical protein
MIYPELATCMQHVCSSNGSVASHFSTGRLYRTDVLDTDAPQIHQRALRVGDTGVDRTWSCQLGVADSDILGQATQRNALRAPRPPAAATSVSALPRASRGGATRRGLAATRGRDTRPRTVRGP